MKPGNAFRKAFILCFVILFIAPASMVWGQEIGDDTQKTTPSGSQTLDRDKTEALPPLSQEIAASVTKWPDTFAWRAATTGTGSFPFTYFFTNLAFDLVRFGISGLDPIYAPWPFRNQNSAGIASGERAARIGTALGVSIAIGLLDSFLSKP